MSRSSLRALAYADGLRINLSQNEVHSEHLVLGLAADPDSNAQRLLAGVGIDPAWLESVLVGVTGTALRPDFTPGQFATLPPVSRHVSDALDNAVQIAGDVGSDQVDATHLLKGMLSVPDCNVVQTLANQGIRASDIAVDADDNSADPAGRPQLLAGAIADTVPVPGGHRVHDADRLGIAADVEMLVSVLLAWDTPLPLAVGLFGDWGSGKSFFMALMYERIEELARYARDRDPAGRPYCEVVRQVRFNAWHYVDTDLWASLAATMFDGLARADAPGKAEAALARLDKERDRAQAAQHEREALERQVRELEVKVDRPTLAARSALSVALRAVRDTKLINDLKSAAKVAGDDPDEKTALVVDSINEIATGGERAAQVWRLFREELAHQRRRATVMTMLVLVALAALIGAIAHWSVGLKALTIAGSVAVGLLPALSGAVRVLYLAREARETRQLPLILARRNLQEARAQENLAKADVELCEQRLAQLRDRGLQLRDFVRERAASPDYRDKLGVISLVRHDFEQLVALMSASRPEFPSSLPAVSKLVPDYDRIFLYIDDLDRCPPAKVVEVLQAVHLLLAFDLFVVVVGVDSRWLEASLRQYYSDLLEEPIDYLDKIFQIPFTLRGMSSSGYRDLIGTLTPAEPTTRRRAGREAEQRATPDRAGAAPTEIQADKAPDSQDQSATMAAQAEGNADATNRAESDGNAGEGAATSQAAARQLPPPPETLVISDEEREFLGRLSALVRTPRAAKRLVNIYRMLRVSVPEHLLDRFGPGGGEYQAVAILLAILVGLPSRAQDVFMTLVNSDPDSNIKDVLTGGYDDIARVLDEISDLKVTSVRSYQNWAPAVSRFSFRLASLPTPRDGSPGRPVSGALPFDGAGGADDAGRGAPGYVAGLPAAGAAGSAAAQAVR